MKTTCKQKPKDRWAFQGNVTDLSCKASKRWGDVGFSMPDGIEETPAICGNTQNFPHQTEPSAVFLLHPTPSPLIWILLSTIFSLSHFHSLRPNFFFFCLFFLFLSLSLRQNLPLFFPSLFLLDKTSLFSFPLFVSTYPKSDKRSHDIFPEEFAHLRIWISVSFSLPKERRRITVPDISRLSPMYLLIVCDVA